MALTQIVHTSSILSWTTTWTPSIYTLSLHDALPIFAAGAALGLAAKPAHDRRADAARHGPDRPVLGPGLRRALRSEEHTSELQSRRDLVCRLLLEKKNISDDSTDILDVHPIAHARRP